MMNLHDVLEMTGILALGSVFLSMAVQAAAAGLDALFGIRR